MLAGLDRGQIAQRTGVQRDAVSRHLFDIRRRLGVSDDTALLAALREMNRPVVERLRNQPRRWCDV